MAKFIAAHAAASAREQVYRAFGLQKLADAPGFGGLPSALSRAGAGALSAALPGAIAGGGIAYLTARPDEEHKWRRVAGGAALGGIVAAGANAARHGLMQRSKNLLSRHFADLAHGADRAGMNAVSELKQTLKKQNLSPEEFTQRFNQGASEIRNAFSEKQYSDRLLSRLAGTPEPTLFEHVGAAFRGQDVAPASPDFRMFRRGGRGPSSDLGPRFVSGALPGAALGAGAGWLASDPEEGNTSRNVALGALGGAAVGGIGNVAYVGGPLFAQNLLYNMRVREAYRQILADPAKVRGASSNELLLIPSGHRAAPSAPWTDRFSDWWYNSSTPAWRLNENK